MLNCTRETKLATILMVMRSKVQIAKPKPITVEQIDQIPEIAQALLVYNDEHRKKQEREDAMRFISERVQDFCGKAIYPEENAAELGEYFNLPNYSEMEEIIGEQLKAEKVLA